MLFWSGSSRRDGAHHGAAEKGGRGGAGGGEAACRRRWRTSGGGGGVVSERKNIVAAASAGSAAARASIGRGRRGRVAWDVKSTGHFDGGVCGEKGRLQNASDSCGLRQLRIVRLRRGTGSFPGRHSVWGWEQHRRDFFSSATRQIPVGANGLIQYKTTETTYSNLTHPSFAMVWYLVALGISNMTPVHAKISSTVHDTLCIDKLNKRNRVAHRSRVLTKGNVVQCLLGLLLASSLRALRQRDVLLRTKTESSRSCALHLLQAKLF